jgi:hypothetical protein
LQEAGYPQAARGAGAVGKSLGNVSRQNDGALAPFGHASQPPHAPAPIAERFANPAALPLQAEADAAKGVGYGSLRNNPGG